MDRLPDPILEVLPPDISAYRRGNWDADYVHVFDSGRPGPQVVINALSHGNEICGAAALIFLLEQGVRPRRGRLGLSFANIAAYERFDPDRPFDNRQVDRDFNRVWSDALLDAPDGGREVDRARQLRPLYASADALLDIHSTANPVHAMFCYVECAKTRALAGDIGYPVHHILSPGGLHPGPLLFEYGRFGDADDPATALLVECGQHFAARSGRVAISAALGFLARFGMIDADVAAEHFAGVDVGAGGDGGAAVRYRVTEVVSARTDQFRFARPLLGFEEFAEGDLIALDDGHELRAPYGRCTVIMPRRRPEKGNEVVSLAERV